MSEKYEPGLVSVIILTYNRADLVHRAIQSVLNQTYQNFEIIVVDDGAIDNTEEEVKNFKNTRIRYIRHKENHGGSAARSLLGHRLVSILRYAYGAAVVLRKKVLWDLCAQPQVQSGPRPASPHASSTEH